MPGGDAELIINIAAEIGDLHSQLNKAEEDIQGVKKSTEDADKSAGGFGNTLGDLGGKAAGLALGGIGLLAGGLIAATKAASDEQVGMDRLGQALSNNVPGWKGNEDAVEGYVSKMENMAFADDKIRDSLGSLVARTHDLSEAQKLQTQAMDLARAKNIDLQTATDIIGKVYDGNTGILARYGIQVDKGATSTQALAAIQAMAGGQAETYAKSAAGSMDRLQVAFGDAVETIGHEFLPMITDALSGLASFISSPEFQAGFQAFADFLGQAVPKALQFAQGAISAILPIVQPFVQALMNLFSSIANGGDVMGSLGKYFSDIGAAIGNAWSKIAPALGQLLGNILNWIGANGPSILGQLMQWAAQFDLWIWNSAIPKLMSALGGLISQLWSWIQANGPGILAQLGVWAQQFGAWLWNTGIPTLMQALGNLLSALFSWIQQNGPGILTQLGVWAQAFGSWVLNTALPGLLSALGSLIGSLWNWIVSNGPGIVQQLLTWAAAFGNWVLTTALPALLTALGSLLGSLWNWIVQAAPGIYQQLLTWKDQFFNWIMTSVVPNLPIWLGNIATALWNFISTNAPVLLTQLGQWKDQFFNWVMTSVLPNIPIWLGNLAAALWTWITNTATDLGTRLVNEWIPKFWNWLTGAGGVKDAIGGKLDDAWTSFTNWVTTTAAGIGAKVLSIGSNIVDGIKQGISNGWDAFKNWVMGLLGGVVDAVKNFFGIKSPSTLMADEVGKPLALGIGTGFAGAWPGVQKDILDSVGAVAKGAQAALNDPKNNPGPNGDPKNQPGNSFPGNQPGNSFPGNQPGPPNFPGNNPERTPVFPGNLPPGAGASSGGSGARSFAVGFAPITGPASGGAAGVTLNLYLDGVLMSAQQVSQKLGLRTRLTAVTT